MFYNQIRLFFANYGQGRDDITIEHNIFLENSTLDGGVNGAKLTTRNNSSTLRFRNISDRHYFFVKTIVNDMISSD